MADWYVSSVVYASIPVWAATHAYTVGQFVKPTAPAYNTSWTFRCTVAGTSASTEPNWSSSAYPNNGTITSGGATFQNVSGQSAYGWSAAAALLFTLCGNTISNRAAPGDRIFLSSDHNEAVTIGGVVYGNSSAQGFGQIQLISVNRAGSVPPVAADYLAGAAVTNTSTGGTSITLDAQCDMYWQGITISAGAGGSNGGSFTLNSSGNKAQYFKNCAFVFNGTTSTSITTTGGGKMTFDNTTIQFGAAGQSIVTNNNNFEINWVNTPAAFPGATFPTLLFTGANNLGLLVTCRGVDLSALTGTLYGGSSAKSFSKILLDSCKIASGLTRLGSSYNSAADEVELVNCYNGTSILSERYTPAGALTTERTITLSGGAADDVGGFSHKMVSNTQSDQFTLPLEGFWLDVENTAIGASKTATVEIVSSSSLNNNDIRLVLGYQGAAGSSLATFADSLASVLTSAAALPASTATWSSLPATPVKQKLQVTFTPQTAGRVRGQVRLGKASTTVYANPVIAIT